MNEMLQKSTFGARLAELRKAAGITQEELGQGMAPDGSDVGKGGVSSWEVGRTSPSASQVPKLCARLRCTPGDLFADGLQTTPATAGEGA